MLNESIINLMILMIHTTFFTSGIEGTSSLCLYFGFCETLSDRSKYLHDLRGHKSVACFSWLLNAPNFVNVIDYYCSIESSSCYGKSSWVPIAWRSEGSQDGADLSSNRVFKLMAN